MTIHEDLAKALSAAGIGVVEVVPESGRRSAPNPTRISVRDGPRHLVHYQLFAWNITHEGKGRVGDNLRVQATSFGQGNSPVTVDEWVLGVGWSGDHGVFVGFDPWIKRNPGSSSSVHIKRQLLEVAAAQHWLEGGDNWDPRVGFVPSESARFLPWAQNLWVQKTVSVICHSVEVVDTDRIIVRIDPSRSKRAYGVRSSDRLAIFDKSGKNPDGYLWRVQGINTVTVVLNSGRNRFHYLFTCEKSARVRGQLETP
jgi:hypothetical protein